MRRLLHRGSPVRLPAGSDRLLHAQVRPLEAREAHSASGPA